MTFASGKDKMDISEVLDVGTEQGFHILFGIFSYLLEFVECYDTGFVCLFQTLKYLFQGEFGCGDVS